MKKLILLLLFVPVLSLSQTYELTYTYSGPVLGESKAKGTIEIIDDKKIIVKQFVGKDEYVSSYDVELFFEQENPLMKKYSTPDIGDVSKRLTFMKADFGKKRQYSLTIDAKDNFTENKIITTYYLIIGK